MNFTNLPEPGMPWWSWFLIFWGAVFVLWLCVGNKNITRKPNSLSK